MDTIPSFLPPTLCLRSSNSRLPFLRWTCALLISVSAATLGACAEPPSSPLVGPTEEPRAQERLSEIASAIASAMNSADVRSDILAAMRASPRVDHNLILGEFLAEPRAEEFLKEQRSCLGVDRTAIFGYGTRPS